mmetsp:Transcript_87241/g.236448  ORF Transcript_87241/g.236448 Transcript_87241/m.236448 type:complete len:266 (-) Transcript_87241:141-938(-)
MVASVEQVGDVVRRLVVPVEVVIDSDEVADAFDVCIMGRLKVRPQVVEQDLYQVCLAVDVGECHIGPRLHGVVEHLLDGEVPRRAHRAECCALPHHGRLAHVVTLYEPRLHVRRRHAHERVRQRHGSAEPAREPSEDHRRVHLHRERPGRAARKHQGVHRGEVGLRPGERGLGVHQADLLDLPAAPRTGLVRHEHVPAAVQDVHDCVVLERVGRLAPVKHAVRVGHALPVAHAELERGLAPARPPCLELYHQLVGVTAHHLEEIW